MKALAKWTYVAMASDEISLVAGEVFTAHLEEGQQWCRGERATGQVGGDGDGDGNDDDDDLSSQSGLFPVNYCTEADKDAPLGLPTTLTIPDTVPLRPER